MPGGVAAEASVLGAEFERLERALQQNLESLQELRAKLLPYQDSSRNALFWTWADVVAITSRFRDALRLPARARQAATVRAAAAAAGKLGLDVGQRQEIDPADQLTEFATMAALFFASCCGLLGASALAVAHVWGWVMGSLVFGSANAVLLLNYSRLHLPHVRRRLEHRLNELSRQREMLLSDVQRVQQASQKSSLVHIRAHIFLQSVNVIRNINYLALCVKTEVQRVGAAGGHRTQQQRIATSGLQLLLALLPHSCPNWQHEALSGENCFDLAALLFGRRRGLSARLASSALAERFVESRKRLWLLFRMVHLSSTIPNEVQGHLGALAERYLRPVLVERRVPLDFCPALHKGADAASKQAMLEDSERGSQAPKVVQPTSVEENDDEDRVAACPSGSSSRARASPASEAGSRGSAGSDDRFSFCASTASQASGSNASMRSNRPGDTSKALRKLVATRSDVAKVLARLPSADLLSQSACSSQTESVLKDIFESIVLALPRKCLSGDSSAEGHVVAVAIGHRFGAKPYALQSVQSSVELLLAVPTSQAGAPISEEGLAFREVSVPIFELTDEEPSTLDVVAAWTSLAAAQPLRFNEASLRSRRRHLRRAKDALRSMSSLRK
eukprot:gb/GFBE01075533.1/.p1 GENE.gb/GFBE01075533.1/~~gb/GFBE01075533.1/.p1  ORF type:complete len:619 (+),score=100.84 gb/GFBE01075533.1/:1-1857(+)